MIEKRTLILAAMALFLIANCIPAFYGISQFLSGFTPGTAGLILARIYALLVLGGLTVGSVCFWWLLRREAYTHAEAPA